MPPRPKPKRAKSGMVIKAVEFTVLLAGIAGTDSHIRISNNFVRSWESGRAHYPVTGFTRLRRKMTIGTVRAIPYSRYFSQW